MDSILEHDVDPVTMSKVARTSGLYPAASKVWTRHPDLKDVTNKLHRHLGASLPGGLGGSLLQDCLVDAITAYRKAEDTHLDPVLAYVEALYERAADVFDLSVTANVHDGRVAWDPLEEPLDSFCKRYPESEIAVVRQSRDGDEEVIGESLMLLGARLLPEYMARHIARVVVKRNTQTAD
jgi:hypothetical protein